MNASNISLRQNAASYHIPVRQMNFGFSKQSLPQHHAGNNPLFTAVFSNLSAAIPEGERFFVRSVRHFRQQITDTALQKAIAGFIGQEAFHAREHDQLNLALAKLGLPMQQHEQIFSMAIRFLEKLPPKMQLSATAGMEHFTAVIAEGLLRDDFVRSQLPELILDFWMWHAIEESEHKAVAFDVYQQISGSYTLRAGTMLLVSAIYWPLVLGLIFKQIIQSGDVLNLRKTAYGLWVTLGPTGFFTKMTFKFLDYFRPDFHPNDHDTDALLKYWRDQLMQDNGRLNTYLKKAA